MIKINSELPLCLFDKNNDLNEYDFVLYHLYISNDEYRNYYLNQKEQYPNRLMILDNSAYEFSIKGETLNIELYIDVINELCPDMYILPDTLMNFMVTYNKTKEFIEHYSCKVNPHSSPMAVLQGNTENELCACALLYKDLGIKNIAIPFHNDFYSDTVPEWYEYVNIINKYRPGGPWGVSLNELNKDMRYASGRVHWILQNEQLVNSFSHVHILGSHCPAEKVYYKTIKSIETMDTGYPVKLGYSGQSLFSEVGKPDIIIDEFFNSDLNDDTKQLIISNVNTFKQL